MKKENLAVKQKQPSAFEQILESDTEFAFLKSLSQSKELAIFTLIGAILFGGFFAFLYVMAS
ncbi:MAG: hypothetical protein ACPGR2_15200 [Psychrobium sp.]